MKKILALLLALVMVVGLCACGEKSNGDDTQTSTETKQPVQDSTHAFDDVKKDTAKQYPNQNEDGTINLDTIAHFDPEYDYTQNERFKVCYITASGGPLYEQSAQAYEHWAPLFNMEWTGYINTNGDSDLYISSLRTQLDNGVRGFILDPDSTIFPSVMSVLDEYEGVCWMSQMSPPRDGTSGEGVPVGGNLINNYVGFDNVDSGRQVANRAIRWMKETYPDVSFDEVGFLMADYSTSPPLHERVIGSKEAFLAAGGKEENFIVADLVSSSAGMTMQAGMDVCGPAVSNHPEIKYWVGNGLFDDVAQGAAAVLDQQGLTDTSCICVFGGSGLIAQFDAGQQDAFRYAIFTAQTLYGEPIIGAVYAYLMGWATPDSIWPSWVKYDDKGAGDHTYSQLRLPTEPLEYENYKQYLAWTDLVAHSNIYGYSQEGITEDMYSKFVDEVPAEYKAP